MLVSFFLPRYPNPSETFIEAQIEGLLERGCTVEVVTLSLGETAPIAARWGEKLRFFDLRVGRKMPARAPAALAALATPAGRAAWDAGRFGYEAAALRLAATAARWPNLEPAGRVWLAHYGRWGAFAQSLRDLGLIQGPLATVFHGKDMSAYLRRRPHAYDRLLAQGDLHLPISNLWRDKLISIGAAPEKTLLHRMGVDSRRFTETPRTLGPGEAVRFLGVGRMVEKKGFDDAIGAFARFRAMPGAPPATLTLIGAGPLKGALEAQARAEGLGEAIRFTGVLPHAEVARLLSEAHLFVLASKTAPDGDMEGIPVALMEAMAQGMAVLTTRHSGIPELVEHDVAGLVCDEADRAALAANMAALAAAPQRWPAMGAAGAARVRAEFDNKLWNDRLAERLAALAR